MFSYLSVFQIIPFSNSLLAKHFITIFDLYFCIPFLYSNFAPPTSVSVLTWTAQLSTKSNGHALPVTGCTSGGLSGGMTKCWKEESSHPGGNSAKT